MTAVAEKTEIALAQPRGVIADMAALYRMDPVAFERTLRATVFPVEASKEQFAAFLLVAREFQLNPLTKQIYAFPDKKGGVVPIVPIDGWMAIVNRNPNFDGMEFIDQGSEAGISAITCKIYRKDRARPTEVTEYMAECKRPTEPWKQWPVRMLRHKAAIQCARYAFALSGIHDPDEYERIVAGEVVHEHTGTQPQRGAAGLKTALLGDGLNVSASGATDKPKPTGTPELRDAAVAKFKECKDTEILALVRDELNLYEWTAPDQQVIDEAYAARKNELEG